MNERTASDVSSASTTTPCHVFTAEWIAAQKQRHGTRPAHHQSLFYQFGTSDYSRRSRETLERWVDALPPEKRKKVIKSLRSETNFDQTFNELAVGASLRALGHNIEYEPCIAGLTPDWLVIAVEGRFILEVLTSNPSVKRKKCDEGWDRVRRHLETIPGKWNLSVQPPHPTPVPGEEQLVYAPDAKAQKLLVRQVRAWLETHPAPGEEIVVDDVTIVVVDDIPQAEHVGCGVSLTPFWVDPVPLSNAIEEKASKYRRIVEAERLPFVVSVLIDLESGRPFDYSDRAVFGEWRDNGGLFHKYPSLSAVTHTDQTGKDVIHRVLRNPGARFPLESWALPSKQGGG
jgi:hypothetical protein